MKKEVQQIYAIGYSIPGTKSYAPSSYDFLKHKTTGEGRVNKVVLQAKNKGSMPMIALYPSLICANPLKIGQVVSLLSPYCAGFHLDFMDNHAVPNLHGSIALANTLGRVTSKPLWLHFMVENPLNLVERVEAAGPGTIMSLHVAQYHLFEKLKARAQENRWQLSLVLSPTDDIKAVLPLVGSIDHILLMSVMPGFAGQPFLPATFDRLDQLVTYKQAHNLPITIAIDGGVTADLLPQLANQGVQQAVIGNALFKHEDLAGAMKELSSMGNKL